MTIINPRVESGNRKIVGNVYTDKKPAADKKPVDNKKPVVDKKPIDSQKPNENREKIKHVFSKDEDQYYDNTGFTDMQIDEEEFRAQTIEVQIGKIDEDLANTNFFEDITEDIENKDAEENDIENDINLADDLEEAEDSKENDDKNGINVPDNLKNNYYGLYSHMMESAEADNAVNALINDKSMWSPDSMSTSKEKLIDKLDGIFNVKGSVFKDKGNAIVQAALDNGINPELFAAKIMAENDLGTSQKTKNYNNPGWVRSSDNSYNRYDTIEEGIESMAFLLAKADERGQGGTNGYNLANKSRSMVEVDSIYAPGNTKYSEFLAKRLLAIQSYRT